jgi:hypothetical protein
MLPVYLSNDPSDISGYLKAYIGGRSPNASTTVSSAVTNTVAGITTTTTPMTLTAGGSTAQWITAPLESAVTISGTPNMNLWGVESSGSANALIAFTFAEYTTSAQAAFFTSSIGTELATTAARVTWLKAAGETLTSTVIDAGNRLIIAPVIGAAGGQMASGHTVTMTYNGATDAIAGDTYVVMDETFEAGQAQVGSGTTPGITGKGVSYFYDLAQAVQNAINEGLIDSNTQASAIIAEADEQKALV